MFWDQVANFGNSNDLETGLRSSFLRFWQWNHCVYTFD